jgi:hypothetical protein
LLIVDPAVYRTSAFTTPAISTSFSLNQAGFLAGVHDCWLQSVPFQQELTLKRLINLVSVEADDDRTVDDDDRNDHVTKFVEIGQCSWIFALCPSPETLCTFAKETLSLDCRTFTRAGDKLRHSLSFHTSRLFCSRASNRWSASFHR